MITGTTILAVVALTVVFFYFQNAPRGRDESCLNPLHPVQVQWNVVVSAILSGTGTCVFQSHHLDVFLSLNNGTVLATKEPAIDDVFQVVQQCASRCDGMG